MERLSFRLHHQEEPHINSQKNLNEGPFKSKLAQNEISKTSHRHYTYLNSKLVKSYPCSHIPVFFLQIKLYSLCKRQIFTVIYRIRLSTHIDFPAIRARFSPSARFFFTTESTSYLRTRCT